MFITHDEFKSQFTSLDGQTSEFAWSVVELVSAKSWFLVRVSQVNPIAIGQVVRTLLFSRLSDIEKFFEVNFAQAFTLESVLIVTPDHVNNTLDWQMERLLAVHEARDPICSSGNVEIFETASRRMYPISELGTTAKTIPCEPTMSFLLPGFS